MIRDFHLADFLTLANGVCGTSAVFFAMDHVRFASTPKIYAAGAFVVLALVFDVMDGRVPRRWAVSSIRWPTSSVSASPPRPWRSRWA
jgi:phosphatidylserine synthase